MKSRRVIPVDIERCSQYGLGFAIRSIRRWCGLCPVLCFCHGKERATEQMAPGRPKCRKAVAALNDPVGGFLGTRHQRTPWRGGGFALICVFVIFAQPANATLA